MSNSLPTKPNSSVPSYKASARLAQELAAGLSDPKDILERFGLTKAQLQRIVQDKHFKELYGEAKRVWNSMDNVEERIRAKSMYLLEDSILPLYSIIHNNDLQPAARIDAFSKLMKISDMEPKKDVDNSGNTFTVTINVPGEDKPVIIEHVPNDQDFQEDE